jgi:hypothetical protein
MKKVKFFGIDSWNRPIFKAIDEKKFFGSTDILFNYGATKEEVLSKIKDTDLFFFGNKFDCEPWGTDCCVEIERI